MDGGDRTRALAVTVPRRQAGELLTALGPWLLGGLRLYCLDGGNLFDCAGLAAWLRAQGADVPAVLAERLFISRAFTGHQLAGAVDELLAPLAEPGGPPRAALLLGVEALFLDEDIRLAERRYLYGRVVARSVALARRGLPVLLTCAPETPEPWRGGLERQARVVALAQARRALPGWVA